MGKKQITFTVAGMFFLMISILVLYEIIENVRYTLWKAHFDGYGDFERLTIPSVDDILIWEYKPYAHYKNIVTNRYGFREEDADLLTKHASEYRVAFIGDSVTLGFGVDVEKTFVRRFEKIAQTKLPGHNVRGLNFGIDGYNTIQIEALLNTKVLDFSPDKVIYVMCLNDFDFEDASAGKIRYFRKPASFFLYRIRRLYKLILGINYQEVKYHRYYFKKNKDIVFQSILAMRETLRERNISFCMAIVPVKSKTMIDFKQYALQDVHDDIMHFLKKNKINSVDLLPIFQQSEKPPEQTFLDIWHPNASGHQTIADALIQQFL